MGPSPLSIVKFRGNSPRHEKISCPRTQRLDRLRVCSVNLWQQRAKAVAVAEAPAAAQASPTAVPASRWPNPPAAATPLGTPPAAVARSANQPPAATPRATSTRRAKQWANRLRQAARRRTTTRKAKWWASRPLAATPRHIATPQARKQGQLKAASRATVDGRIQPVARAAHANAVQS